MKTRESEIYVEPQTFGLDVTDLEANDKEPWKIYRGDFGRGSHYYDVSRPYRIWYEYMNLSPTFALAEKYIQYELSEEELNQCPDDFFDRVVPTCKDMQLSLGHGSFDLWWLRHGADIFGKRTLDPELQQLMSITNRQPVNPSQIIEPFTNYLENVRLNDGNHGFMVVAVPLSMNRKTAIKSFSSLLDEAEKLRLQAPELKTYKLDGVKVHTEPLPKNLRVLWEKALHPELALWRLGLLSDAADGKYLWLDPSIKKHTNQSKKDSENLASITSMRLKEAVIIMENAARGRFPCSSDRKLPKLDHNELLQKVSKELKFRMRMHKYGQERHEARQKNRKKMTIQGNPKESES